MDIVVWEETTGLCIKGGLYSRTVSLPEHSRNWWSRRIPEMRGLYYHRPEFPCGAVGPALPTNLNETHQAYGSLVAPGPSCVEDRYSRPSSFTVVCFYCLRELPGAAGDPIPQGTSAHHVPAASA